MTETPLVERLNAIVAMNARPPKKISAPLMRDIAHVVSEFYGESLQRLREPNEKKRAGAYPRQIAYFLCRMLTDYSYPQIAHFFHRDHTTVLHGARGIHKRMQENEVTMREIEILKDRIEGERQCRTSNGSEQQSS